VVPEPDLESAVQELVAQIARSSREVIAIGKEAFYAQVDASQSDAYAITVPVMSANAAHWDAQEGMTAFLEKRNPKWAST
jgi:enoyl-CoA hydratase/carnithine racemase